METITLEIDGKERNFRVMENEDLTVKDWFAIYDKYNEPEYKDVEWNGGEIDKEAIPKEEWSDEFIWNKQIELCLLFCNIPRRFYDEYLGLTEFVLNMMPSLEYDKVDEPYIMINGIKLEPVDLGEITFQHWADIESLSNPHALMSKIAPVVLYYMEKGVPYMGVTIDIHDKIKEFEMLNAKEYMNTIFTAFEAYADFRKSFINVYENFGTESTVKTPFMNKHYQKYGWYDTIITVAETGLFGTLRETRNTKAVEVLGYLNIKRHRDAAESRDYLINNKPIK